MNKILIITVIFLSSIGLAAQDSATIVMKNAMKLAQKENKNVFLMFHASWCGWCRKMDRHMNDERCKAFFDKNYIIEHLDVMESGERKNLENPGAFDLLKSYKAEKSGIPFFVILDKNGKLLEDSFDANGQNLGCPASKEEVDEFIRMLKATSALNDKELEIIYNQFLIKK
jgi:thioredoxin-related protein